MFDFSFSELLVVCVVGLLILGPKELPVVVRSVRGFIRSIKQTTASIQQQVNDVLDDDTIEQTKRLIEGDDGSMYEAFDLSDMTEMTEMTALHKPDTKEETPNVSDIRHHE